MAVVINNIVKKEWDTAGWYELKIAGRTGSVFAFSSQEYVNAEGRKITVFFRPAGAFLFVSNAGTPDEDLWNAKELKKFLRSEGFDEMFPDNYDEYVPILCVDEEGGLQFVESTVETYGLQAHRDDIQARLDDIAPYGYSKEVKPGEG